MLSIPYRCACGGVGGGGGHACKGLSTSGRVHLPEEYLWYVLALHNTTEHTSQYETPELTTTSPEAAALSIIMVWLDSPIE